MLSEKIEKLIHELQLSPEEFGNKINVGKSSIYKLLRGDIKKLTSKMAAKINSAFPEYSLEYLNGLNYDTLEPNKDNTSEPAPGYKKLKQKQIEFITKAFEDNFYDLMAYKRFKKEFLFRATEVLGILPNKPKR
ncbi:hypothetical protein [Flavivirga rizhaonensis]|uniref:HTH cro/C1-type domain-containing protein n=1 Tax=Flavivirga rizhaonensis TaxID=2559571 RepID=A0A4S1DTF1_9FLAO|nr:hypothetical protein [Flavivirga rizhaonensis]TGV01320.1 hypothetical protein EM932_16140 [Flavivirga rizhaonensis]